MSASLEHGRALLERARGDRHVAATLAADPDAPPWSVGFHAQQAVEKAVTLEGNVASRLSRRVGTKCRRADA